MVDPDYSLTVRDLIYIVVPVLDTHSIQREQEVFGKGRGGGGQVSLQ